MAYNQSLDNLLVKSRQYIKYLSIDIVIAVDCPQPTIVQEEPDSEFEKPEIVKGRIGSSNGEASYTRSGIGSSNRRLSLHHVSRWFKPSTNTGAIWSRVHFPIENWLVAIKNSRWFKSQFWILTWCYQCNSLTGRVVSLKLFLKS